jgi:MoxR-like ATPase
MYHIVEVHHPHLPEKLSEQALSIFYELRALTRLRKRPSTSELVDWIAALKASGVSTVKLDENLPFVGALLKREQDLQALTETFGGNKRTRA